MYAQIRKSFCTLIAVAIFGLIQVSAQNKDIDKGKETLAKAMEQTDASKRQDLITKARESFQKGGMKPQEMSALIGDAYLEKGDLINAYNSFNAATKEAKKDGIRRVAEAYVDQAFNEEDKARNKSLSKAMSYFGKSDATKEGARMIGDRYYELGKDSYDKALESYVIGENNVKIEQIAKEYFAAGGDNEVKAAETYLKLKDEGGAKKAGDIYYDRKEYQKAIEAYLVGGVEEGISKYADYLYGQNRSEDADNLIMQLADAYFEKKNDDALEKLAAKTMNKGSYALASKLYDKAGNTTMRDKSAAYDALVNFRLEEAKSLFSSIGDAASEKMIVDNQKYLDPLSYLSDNMEDLKRYAPFVSLIVDSLTGESVPSASDKQMQEDYYKSVKDQIVKNVMDLSAAYAKVTNTDLKKFIRVRFLKFAAVRNILDNETFTVKKQKQDIKVKDVVL